MANMCNLTILVECQSADDKKKLYKNFQSRQEAFISEVGDDFNYMFDIYLNDENIDDDDDPTASIDAQIKWGFDNDRCVANLINYILDLANVNQIEVYYEEIGNQLYGLIKYESGDDYLTCRGVKPESWPEDDTTDTFYEELDELLDNDDEVFVYNITL